MLRDHRALYRGHALAVVAPADTAAVSRVLAFCNEHHIGVVPQGGNTSYCGGATPDASSSQVLLSLARLNRVRGIDAAITPRGSRFVAPNCNHPPKRRPITTEPRQRGQLHARRLFSTAPAGSVIRYGIARTGAGSKWYSPTAVAGHAHGAAQDNTSYDIVAVPRRRDARRDHGRLHQAVSVGDPAPLRSSPCDPKPRYRCWARYAASGDFV